MTLSDLSEFVGTYYPQGERTVPRILYVWSMLDEDGGLEELLRNARTTKGHFSLALEPFIDDSADEDRQLLTRVIIETRVKPIMGYDIISTLCNNPDHRIYRALQSAGVDMAALNIWVKRACRETARRHGREGTKAPRKDALLLKYGRELTSLAEMGSFDDLSDRNDEIDRIIGVLLRRSRRNVMLTGPAGVGKTALVEVLSRRFARNLVPARLTGAKVYEIGMGAILAGTTLRGMFEERLTQIIDTLVACQPALLFIDEAHLIWGAGRAEGSPMDAANILKPILAGSKIAVIGATTIAEYHRYIARDPALARRFQEVRIEAPGREATVAILARHARSLEEFHGISIAPHIPSEAWQATERHLVNRSQPDKSVELLAGAAVLVESEGRRDMVTDDLYRILSRQTGRAMTLLGEGAVRDLKGLESSLNNRVIGQEQAVRSIVSTLISRRYDDERRGHPLGTFLFSGATGVGKTELSRALAEGYFGSSRDFLHIDLAEYSGQDAIHKLIGTPYGPSAGFAEGLLTRWLHERSSGVILFDELEKAHPDIHRLLIGLLDEGRITSGMGECFDISRCIIVVTTNALRRRDLNKVRLGFVPSGHDDLQPFTALSKHFPEEVLGRLDEIIIFRTPSPQEYRKILGREVDEILDRLRDKGIFVICDRRRLLDFLCDGNERPMAGARDLIRLIRRRLVQPIAWSLADHDPGDIYSIELTDEFYDGGTLDPVSVFQHA